MVDKKILPAKPAKSKSSKASQKTISEIFKRKNNQDSNHNVLSEKSAGDQQPGTNGGGVEPPPSFSIETSVPPSTRALRPKNARHPPAHQPSQLYPLFHKHYRPAPISTLADDDSTVMHITDVECIPSSPSSVSGTTEDPPASSEGNSSYDPIVIESSPAKPTSESVESRRSPERLAPIFVIRERKPQKSDSDLCRRPAAAAAGTLVAAYPTHEFQHIRGPQTSFGSLPPLLARRSHRNSITSRQAPPQSLLSKPFFRPTLNDRNAAISRGTHRSSDVTLDRDRLLDTIPQDDRSHPAIKRFLEPSPTSSSRQTTWTEKWRPTRAEQVLGNEKQSLYLRDWLHALELQLEPEPPSQQGKTKGKAKRHQKGTKRPRVVRAVERPKVRKKRRSGGDGDWIVHTSEEEDWYSDDEYQGPQPMNMDDDEGDYSPPSNSPGIRSHSNFGGYLTNTILLAGPPGCGKSAAVYACATELDWEVFEVYPGIGRRSSSSLDNLIGDVGKNHLVRKTQRDRGCRTARSVGEGFLEKAGESLPSTGDVGFVVSDDLDDSGLDVAAKPSRAATSVRQSMILLEEVDIVYKEDANFWPAVVNLIGECKRPVIMTCTDIALIPTDDLPLQTIMEFGPCPTPLVVSYLQGLCLAEGYPVSSDHLSHLYEATHQVCALDTLEGYVSVQSNAFPVPDLRRTINHLQFWSTVTEKSSASHGIDQVDHSPDVRTDWSTGMPVFDIQTGCEDRIRRLHHVTARHAELLSFVDSDLTRPTRRTPEALAFSDSEPSPDDEVGHRLLFTASSHPYNEFGFHYQDIQMADAAVQLSRGAYGHEPRVIDAANTFDLFRTRVAYQSQILSVLNDRRLAPGICNYSSIYLDYEPWIRFMVDADDEHEQKGEGRLRRTRQSTRYERYITLTDTQRKVLRNTRLGG